MNKIEIDAAVDENLHETHVCRDCGAEITVPYAPPADPVEGLTHDELTKLLRDNWREGAWSLATIILAALRAASSEEEPRPARDPESPAP